MELSSTKLKSVFVGAAVLALMICPSLQAGSVQGGVQTTFTFDGLCTDCAGHGIGTLIVTNYTLGAAFTNANFVSFDYSSNLVPVAHVGSADITVGGFTGSIGSAGPAAQTVTIISSAVVFSSNSGGLTTWCISAAGHNGCFGDIGPSNTYAQVSTPEPGSMAMLFAGVGALALLQRRRQLVAVSRSN